MTPLMMAASRGDMAIMRMLVEAGANVYLECPETYDARDFAEMNSHIECCQYLHKVVMENPYTEPTPLFTSQCVLPPASAIFQPYSRNISTYYGPNYVPVSAINPRPDEW